MISAWAKLKKNPSTTTTPTLLRYPYPPPKGERISLSLPFSLSLFSQSYSSLSHTYTSSLPSLSLFLSLSFSLSPPPPLSFSFAWNIGCAFEFFRSEFRLYLRKVSKLRSWYTQSVVECASETCYGLCTSSSTRAQTAQHRLLHSVNTSPWYSQRYPEKSAANSN